MKTGPGRGLLERFLNNRLDDTQLDVEVNEVTRGYRPGPKS